MTSTLDSLPPSDSDFWDLAEVQKYELDEIESCEHDFSKVEGERAIQCKKCMAGMPLDARDEFKDGHLYRDEKLVF